MTGPSRAGARAKPLEQFRRIPENGSIVRVFYHDEMSNWAWQEPLYGKRAMISRPRKNRRYWAVAHWPTGRTVCRFLLRGLTFAEAAELAKELDERILGAGQIRPSAERESDGVWFKVSGWTDAVQSDVAAVLRDFAERHGIDFTSPTRPTATDGSSPVEPAGGHLAGGGHSAASGPSSQDTPA